MVAFTKEPRDSAANKTRKVPKRIKEYDITIPSVCLKGYSFRRKPVMQGKKSSSKTIYVPKALPDEEYLVILIPTNNPERGGKGLKLNL